MKTLTQHDELLVKPYIDSKIQTLTNQVKDMNNVYGSKNLLPYPYDQTTKTVSGVTFTDNGDGTITLNGTNTGTNTTFIFCARDGGKFTDKLLSNLKKMNTSFKLLGGKESPRIYYLIDFYDSSKTYISSATSRTDVPTKFTIPSNAEYMQVMIRCGENTTYSNLTFYPILYLASIEDDTYEPYAKTNQQLTQDTTGLLDNVEVNGAVNMLPNEATTQVINGVTFTVNDDGSITANGTCNTDIYWNLATRGSGKLLLKNGQYKLSGAKTGVIFTVNRTSGGASVIVASDMGSGKTFTVNGDDYYTDKADLGMYIYVANGTTLSNVKLYPMITVPSYNGDYVPYAKSNKELTVRTDNKFRRTRKNITNYLDNLVTAIADQDLESYGYSIGDYFVGSSGYKYHLADMDTYYGGYASYAVLNTHHIGIVVQTGANSKWNDTNTTATGYSGSVLHTYLTGTVLDNIKSDMIALFGGTTGLEHLLSHQKLLTNNVSAWAWVTDQYISALSEVQVYSSRVWGIDGYQTGEANKPLQIFQKFRFNEIFGNIWFWLRDIMSASAACNAARLGHANPDSASNLAGVVGLILFH